MSSIATIIQGIIENNSPSIGAFIYERRAGVNIELDNTNTPAIILIEISLGRGSIKGNRIDKQFTVTLEIVDLVENFDSSPTNDIVIESMLTLANTVIAQINSDNNFSIVSDIQYELITEVKYDSNVMGWAVTFEIKLMSSSISVVC
jgi:hypothetical protein